MMQKYTVTGGGKFHYTVKSRKSGRAPALKVDAKYQPCLVAFEIDEIKAGSRRRRPPPRLNAPARGQPRAVRQLEIRGWTDKQCLPCKFLQTGPLILPQITCFTTQEEAGTQLCH